MKSLRAYIDILAEADAAAPATGQVNPWAPKQDTTKQDAWAKLSPEQQKWLGGADPTDPIILARMRSAVPDKAPVAGPATGADMDVATQDAGGPAPAATATPVAQGNVEATPLPPAGQGATPAEPVNRDSMSFGSAFADARKKGEPKFTWKGKEYTTQIAPAQTQKVMPQLPKADQAANNLAQAAANVNIAPGYGKKGPTVAAAQGKDAANPLNQTQPAAPAQGATPAAPDPNKAAKIQAEIDRFTKSNNMAYQANKDYVAKLQSQLGAPVQESAYDEVERLVSLIHYR
jgi:hypothetical protein